MLRMLSSSLVAAVLFVVPASLFAGGPPILILPVDGVDSSSAQACVDLLNSKLKDKLWEHSDRRTVRMEERKKQFYFAFDMGGDVALSDVQAALKGSRYSIPQDRLHFFGHAILEIAADDASQQAMLKELKTLPQLSIEQSKTEKGVFQVTLDMPYPGDRGRGPLNTAGWETFQWNDFSSEQAPRSEPPVPLEKLPRLGEIKNVVAKHDGQLKDVRWSNDYSCRPLGAVAEADSIAKPVQVGTTIR